MVRSRSRFTLGFSGFSCFRKTNSEFVLWASLVGDIQWHTQLSYPRLYPPSFPTTRTPDFCESNKADSYHVIASCAKRGKSVTRLSHGDKNFAFCSCVSHSREIVGPFCGFNPFFFVFFNALERKSGYEGTERRLQLIS